MQIYRISNVELIIHEEVQSENHLRLSARICVRMKEE